MALTMPWVLCTGKHQHNAKDAHGEILATSPGKIMFGGATKIFTVVILVFRE